MAFKMKGHTLPGPNQIKQSPAKLAFLIPLAVAAGKAIAKGAVVAGKGAALAGKAIGKGAVVAGKAVGKAAKGIAAKKVAGTTVGKLAGQSAIGTGTSQVLAMGGSQKRKAQERKDAAQQSKLDALKMQQEAMGGDVGTRGRIV